MYLVISHVDNGMCFLAGGRKNGLRVRARNNATSAKKHSSHRDAAPPHRRAGESARAALHNYKTSEDKADVLPHLSRNDSHHFLL